MRILSIHNPRAGNREHSKKQLIASPEAFGHQSVYQSTKKRGWKKQTIERSHQPMTMKPIDAFYERCGREQTTLMSTD
jgi:hypothetical protein